MKLALSARFVLGFAAWASAALVAAALGGVPLAVSRPRTARPPEPSATRR